MGRGSFDRGRRRWPSPMNSSPSSQKRSQAGSFSREGGHAKTLYVGNSIDSSTAPTHRPVASGINAIATAIRDGFQIGASAKSSVAFGSELKRGVLVEYKSASKIFRRFADQLHQATPCFEFDNSRNNIKEKPRNE